MTQNSVRIFEMSPRDGLQNEPLSIPTAAKVTLINLLSKSGFADIEATSFVSPKWVPQLADGAAVMAAIDRLPSVSYAALVPNMTGFDRALAARVDSIGIFAAASQSFSQKNINCSIAESLDRFQPVMAAAAAHKIPVRGYISMVVHCPDDGDTDPQIVADLASRMMDMGCYQISLGDTVGVASPPAIQRLLDKCVRAVDGAYLAGHYHDTGGQALANITASLPYGIRCFDASVGGLGGCPYAPGASGNVCMEDIVHALHCEAIETGIELERLLQVSKGLGELLEHPLSGQVVYAGPRSRTYALEAAARQAS